MDSIEYTTKVGELVQRKLEDGDMRPWSLLVKEAADELDSVERGLADSAAGDVEYVGSFAPKFPHIEVQLSGEDGNAFFILGRVMRALKEGGVNVQGCTAFQEEATSGDYDHLLQTCMRWVTVR